MERDKPPSLTSSSSSVSTSRPESSEGIYKMLPPWQNDPHTPLRRENNVSEPYCVPRMRSQSNLRLDAKPYRSVSVITLKPSSPARTWSPRSVSGSSTGTHSEFGLPMPRIAKFLDSGWKSAPILPNYPKVYPVNRDSNRSVTPPKSPVSNNPVHIPKLCLDHISMEAGPSLGALSPTLHSPTACGDQLQLNERSNEDTTRVLQLPKALSCRSEPSRIPVRKADIRHPFCTARKARSADICYPSSATSSVRSIDIPYFPAADTARESASSRRNSSPQIVGIYRKPSCIPIPLFNTMSREILTERSASPSPADYQSSPTTPTPPPSVIDSSRISIPTRRSEHITPVPTLKALAGAALPKSIQTSGDSARSVSSVLSLKDLAKVTVEKYTNNATKSEFIQENPKVPSLKVLAQNAIDQLENRSASTKMNVPSLKELAEKSLAQMPTKVPALKELAKKVISETDVELNNGSADDEKHRHSNFTTQNLKPDWHYFSTERAATKVTNEEDINADYIEDKHNWSAPTEEILQSPDAWEHVDDERKTCQEKKENLVDLAVYFKSFPTKAKVPSLKELAEAVVKNNIWLQKCEENFANPRSCIPGPATSMDTENAQSESTEAEPVALEKEPTLTARSMKEREMKSSDGNRKRSRPVSRVSGNRRAVVSAKARTEHEAEEEIKRPYSVPLVGLNEQTKAALSARNLTDELAIPKEDKASCQTDKKTKRITKKLDQKKIHRLRYDPQHISNKELYEMVDAIKEDDRDAAKVLKELQLLNEMEKETKMKESELIQAEIKMEEDINDLRSKLEATREKKNEIDKKLLEMCDVKLEAETEYDVIENYLYTENLARTYHDKINLGECCIAYLENERNDSDELRKLVNPKSYVNHRKNGKLQNTGYLNKKRTGNASKPHDTIKKNNKDVEDFSIFKALEENAYKPVTKTKEVALHKDHSDLRKKGKPEDSRPNKINDQSQTCQNRKKETIAKATLHGRRRQEKQAPPLKKTEGGSDNKQLNTINRHTNRYTNKTGVGNEKHVVKRAENRNTNISRLENTRENATRHKIKQVKGVKIQEKDERTPLNQRIPKAQCNVPNKPEQKVNNVQRSTQRKNTTDVSKQTENKNSKINPQSKQIIERKRDEKESSNIVRSQNARENATSNRINQVKDVITQGKDKRIQINKRIQKVQTTNVSKKPEQKMNNGQGSIKCNTTSGATKIQKVENKKLQPKPISKPVTESKQIQNKQLEKIRRPKVEPNKLRQVTAELETKAAPKTKLPSIHKPPTEAKNSPVGIKHRHVLPKIQQKQKIKVQQNVQRQRITS